MSIPKAQADLLAEKFLDNLDTEEKSVLRPKETFSVLFQLAGELVDDAQKNLNESNSNASGGLSKSIVLDEPKENGSVVSVNVLMAKHGLYINDGVKGTKSGQGKYKFKTNNPSPEMLKNLQKSKKRAKRSTKNTIQSKTKDKNELKNFTTSAASVWGAAVNIKKFGIKPTGFMNKAIVTTSVKVDKQLSEAFRVDIINSI